MKIFLLDSLGVGVVGSAGPWAQELVDVQTLWGSDAQARVWVRGASLPAPAAAMCNGYQIHNSEFDCVHEAAVVHPMTVLLAAAIAVAEREGGVSGRDFISALALGVDIGCGIGIASTSQMRFFRPATAGAFAATSAVGKLLGFDADTLVSAYGAMYGELCGTMQPHTEGSMVLAMQIGFNARNAVIACDMAARGLSGPKQVLEGTFGYFTLFEGAYDLSPVLTALGRSSRICEVAHKPFPSGRATHGIVDGCLELKSSYGFGPDDIERVAARVPPLVHQLVARPVRDDMNVNYARLCASYVSARALQFDAVGVDDFHTGALRDAETLSLARRFAIIIDDNSDRNAMTPVTVEITLKDGTRYDKTLDVVYGNPAKPLSREAHLGKFYRNWRSGCEPLAEKAGETLVSAIDELETVGDVAELVQLLVR